jgi:Na+-translocating ferredoxin:NAD+ oxidoreductase RnfE subunit
MTKVKLIKLFCLYKTMTFIPTIVKNNIIIAWYEIMTTYNRMLVAAYRGYINNPGIHFFKKGN